METQTQRDLAAIRRELVTRWRLWLGLGIGLSVILLSIALLLPKTYTSDASIVVEDRNIIGPLMEGMAEQTDIATIAKIVREMAFSRALLDRILEAGDFVDENTTPLEREKAQAELIERTAIDQRPNSVIAIEYTDTSPERAEMVTSMYVNWVLERSDEQKRQESLQAFEFIDQQVREYHDKLKEAEADLQRFRSANLDALPESAADVRTSASRLRQNIENARVELSALRVRAADLREQLSGEAEVTRAMEKEAEIRLRRANLQEELDELRLSYHDTYPDIVRLKNQIASLDKQLEDMGATGRSSLIGQQLKFERDEQGNLQMPVATLYEQLRRDLSETETEIASKQSRIQEMERMLNNQIERGGRIALTEAELAEMSRDYEVNREIYRDLLRRRENARLSMLIDEQQGGLKLRLQEPPARPQAPSGIRYVHIASLSALMVLCLPFGLSAAMVKVDPRLRTREQIEDHSLPVLSVIPASATGSTAGKRIVMFLGVAVLISLYVLPPIIF